MRRSSPPAGTLTVICGSMFAGKTEELIRRARRALHAKKKVQVFKPAIDTRYDESMVVTHMGERHEAIPVSSVSQLRSKIASDTDVVLLEEAQFFDESLAELAMQLADEGREVILAGLDQDFRRKPFGPMPMLLALADEVVKLRAICVQCGSAASHTYRSVEGKPASIHDPIVLIGATEVYEARCRACHGLKDDARAKRRKK